MTLHFPEAPPEVLHVAPFVVAPMTVQVAAPLPAATEQKSPELLEPVEAEQLPPLLPLLPEPPPIAPSALQVPAPPLTEHETGPPPFPDETSLPCTTEQLPPIWVGGFPGGAPAMLPVLQVCPDPPWTEQDAFFETLPPREVVEHVPLLVVALHSL